MKPHRSSYRPASRPPQGLAVNPVRYLLAGGFMLTLLALLADSRHRLPSGGAVSNVCREVVQADAVLSREALSQLLTIPERDRKESVRLVIREPYCRLPSVEVRQGVMAEREAYPLAFDPQTWFVVLYEGDEYAGYSFVFQH